MKSFKALFIKELMYYFNGPVGYVSAVLFAALTNFFFVKDLFLRDNSSLRPLFDIMPWFLLVFCSAVCMRLFAEEKRINTLEVLLTLPVSELSIVLAKVTSAVAFVMLAVFLTISIPVTMFLISTVVIPGTIASYLGVLFLTTSFCSVATYISLLTRNQIVAFLASTIALFFFTILGSDFLSSVLPSAVNQILISYAPLTHYDVFLKGVIDVRSVVYFLTVSVLFLTLSVITLEKRD